MTVGIVYSVALPACCLHAVRRPGINLMPLTRAASRVLQQQYVFQPFMCSHFPQPFSLKVKMSAMIIGCLRERQSVAFQTRFSSKYSTPFDKLSNVNANTRGLGTAIRAGSNLHMYAKNGDRSCSHRLHGCMYDSTSRSTDLEERLR